MTGSTDDSRPGRDALPGRDEALIPARQCPRCDRSTADYVCLHCAAEDDFRGASLVRSFVNFPDLYSKDTPSGSSPDPDPDDRPAPEEPVPTPPPTLAQEQAPGTAADGTGVAPRRVRAVRTRHPLDLTGWGTRGIVAHAAIAGGWILLATAVGIVGAVATGPSDSGGPGVEASPSASHPPGRSQQPAGMEPTGSAPAAARTVLTAPTSAVSGHVIQGSFCLDDVGGGTGNGNPIQLWRCADSDAQRWTFPSDGTMRVLGRCARPVGGEAADSSKIELWDCDGTASQRWLRGSDGNLVHPASGGCLEKPAALGEAHGSRPQLATCDSGPGQRWQLPYAGLSG